MIRTRLYQVALFFFLLPTMAMGQTADFEIQNFHERTTDLSAISSNYKDQNKQPAALIRFTVRDPQFEFSSNWGILGIERKTGEVYLYVPQDTKRLTIRHPRLGVLLDYEIPVRIKSKVTYGADIVITEKEKPAQQPYREVAREPDRSQADWSRNQGDWSRDSEQNHGPVPLIRKPALEPDFHFFAGVGFNAVSLMGPSATLGLDYKGFLAEGGFVFGIDKVENVTFTLSRSSTPTEAYDYTCMKAWARLGYQIKAADHFFIAPMAGATFNMISGKSTLSGNGTDYFKESNPMAVHAAIRLSYEVIDHLFVHLTPQYDFSLEGDQIFEVIKQGDSKLKAWGEGFGVNVGVIYEF